MSIQQFHSTKHLRSNPSTFTPYLPQSNKPPGAGGVGRHFLTQLTHLQKIHPTIRLILISLTSKSLRAPDPLKGLSLSTWSTDLNLSATPPLSIAQTTQFLTDIPGPCVLVDNTSSQDVADAYPEFLRRGISVVTPNKKAFSGDLALWKGIQDAAYKPQVGHDTKGLVYHESSVGAGLPIISTLKDLIETGDTVLKIEGVFSGTMSFLFNNFAPVDGKGGKWSDEVRKAKEAGFTEPDPRDDLNGVDVARKLVILARICGVDVQGTDAFPVQSLIPAELEGVKSGEEFIEKLPQYDGSMEEVKNDAVLEGKVVRFVGSIDVARKALKVGLEKFDKGHPIAGLKGSDNIISFYTERYGANPLIVQGAG